MNLLDTLPKPAGREFPVFDRELLRYLPTVMRDTEELKQIMTAEQPEIFDLWEAVQRVMNEQFIGQMSDFGVRRWENILRIRPSPEDTLDDRKERILLIIRMKLPFTMRWLRRWLNDNIGANNYDLSLDRYTLHIFLNYNAWGGEWRRVFIDVLDLLGWVRPANIVLGITGQHAIYGETNIGAWTEIESNVEIGANTPVVTGAATLGSYVEIQENITIL